MDLKKAMKVYEKTNLSTMPMIGYVLLLLNECLYNVRNCGNAVVENEGAQRNESVSKAQKLLFELMSVTDRRTTEGERLFTYYAYLNQCLVEVRINESDLHLKQIEQALLEMIASWEVARPIDRGEGYTGREIRL